MKRVGLTLAAAVAAFVVVVGVGAVSRPPAALAGTTAADCNGNGVPDVSEASWANRDDDGDGICNGVDTCPYETDATNNPADCAMQAITVPEDPNDPSVPHPTYSGALITLGGIARYGGDQFRWDFGDGSAPTSWTTFANPYNLGVQHAYTGPVGQLFDATLSVRSSANPGVVSTATYPVEIFDAHAAGSDPHTTTPGQVDVLARMAVDKALWYLHVNESRSRFADDSLGRNQGYGYWDGAGAGLFSGATCDALDAYELAGHVPQGSYSTDPYTEDVERGYSYVFHTSQVVSITPTQDGNADSNGNGIGLLLRDSNVQQETGQGACLLALADSRAAGKIALDGPAGLVGATYSSIAQDAADWLSFAQNGGNNWATGSFGYQAYPTSGWDQPSDPGSQVLPILGLHAAESELGATVAPSVRRLLPNFLAATQSTVNWQWNGAWGYTTPSNFLIPSATAGGIAGELFVGQSLASRPVQAGLGFLYRDWGANGTTGVDEPQWNVNLGSDYAMNSIARTLEWAGLQHLTNYDYANNVQTAGTFDWYYTPSGQVQTGIGSYLVANQNANGSWSGLANVIPSDDPQMNAAVDAATLERAGAPVAVAGGPYVTDINQPVTFSDGGSYNPAGGPLTYEWDFNYDGSTFHADATGPTATYLGGYSTYDEDRSGTPLVTVTPHVVALRVTNSAGQQTLATATVHVRPGGTPPVAVLQPALGQVNAPVQFDASQSYDTDGDPLTYAWDFHNSGQFTDATGATPSYTFTSPGTYVVCVQVTDHPDQNATPYQAAAQTSQACQTVVVGAHKPVANPGGPYTSVAGSSITLDGTGSSDADGLALTYAWDLSANGLYNDSTSATPTFTVPASAAVGTVYSVCLRVSTGFSTSTPSCTTVTVVARQQPPVCQIVAPQVIVSNTGATQSITVDGSRSYDVNGNPLTYSWSKDGGPSFDDASAAIAKQTGNFAGAGAQESWTDTLTVNNGYFTSTCTATVEVIDNLPPQLTVPADIVIAAGPDATAKVNAWLASATASDPANPGTPVTVSNDFVSNSGSGGVGAGNTVKVTWTATNPYDSSVTAQKSATVTVTDSTPPEITPSVTGTLGNNGWYTSDVSVDWTVADPESTISSQSGCDHASVTSDTNGTPFTCKATSAGGTASKTVTILRDTIAPAIDPTLTPQPNAAGWNNTDVTASFNCSDAGSGVASCPDPVAFGEGAGQSANVSATDVAGNSRTVDVKDVNVDETPPTLTGAPTTSPNTNGWYSGDVTIHWTCADALSGIAGSCPDDSTLTGEGTLHATAHVSDVAGNETSADSPAVKIDRTAPVTQASAPTGWTNAGVTVALSATDNLSGVDATHWQLDGGPTQSGDSVAIADEGVHTLVYWSVDKAGNAEAPQTLTVKIDKTAPTISALLNPLLNAAGWSNSAVHVTFQCDDALSGIASCTAPVDVTTEGAGQSVTGTAVDNAGNSASDTVSVSIDETPPTVTASADRAPNANGWYNADVLVSFACGDALSGIDVCPAPVTLHEGKAQSASGTARDIAGNTADAKLDGINVDETPPAVAFAGATSYTIGDTVDVACTASDALSGLASSSCPTVHAPATSFGLGATTLSASATDNAGNVGSASFTFTVGVTCSSLKTVIGQWVSDPSVVSGLDAKVDAICSATNASAKNGKLGAFDNQVAAQTGKSISTAHAKLLEQYAAAL